jgi:hypothetical protein
MNMIKIAGFLGLMLVVSAQVNANENDVSTTQYSPVGGIAIPPSYSPGGGVFVPPPA